MERANFDNFGHPTGTVGEPNFDDERTVLSARPVVPLEAVAQVQRKRRLLLIGSVVLAALLGAGVALAMVRLQQPTVVTATDTASTPKPTESVAQVPEAPDVTERQTAQLEPDVGEPDLAEAPIESRPPARVRRVNRQAATTPSVSIQVKATEDESQSQARLVDEWQERRLRRVTRPARRNNNHTDDLFRIREIFEGPRRRP